VSVYALSERPSYYQRPSIAVEIEQKRLASGAALHWGTSMKKRKRGTAKGRARKRGGEGAMPFTHSAEAC